MQLSAEHCIKPPNLLSNSCPLLPLLQVLHCCATLPQLCSEQHEIRHEHFRPPLLLSMHDSNIYPKHHGFLRSCLSRSPVWPEQRRMATLFCLLPMPNSPSAPTTFAPALPLLSSLPAFSKHFSFATPAYVYPPPLPAAYLLPAFLSSSYALAMPARRRHDRIPRCSWPSTADRTLHNHCQRRFCCLYPSSLLPRCLLFHLANVLYGAELNTGICLIRIPSLRFPHSPFLNMGAHERCFMAAAVTVSGYSSTFCAHARGIGCAVTCL